MRDGNGGRKGKMMKKKGTKKKRRSAGTVGRHAAVQKIRIGYLSSDFAKGRGRDFLSPLIAGYDRLSFEVYAYHAGTAGDTKAFAEEVHAFREIGTLSPDAAAEMIRGDDLDLLVDLSFDAPHALIRAIMALHPARHLLSLDEHCPAHLAAALPQVPETADFLPYCYAPLHPVTRYVYRTPVLDCGVPAIGFVGRVQDDMRPLLMGLLRVLWTRMPQTHLILPAAIAAVLTEEDLAQIAALGAETAQLRLVDDLPYETLDIAVGIGIDVPDVCRTAEYGIPLLTAQPLARSRYVSPALRTLGLSEGFAADETELAAQADALLHDEERLSALHALLHWTLKDGALTDAGAYMFAVERAYARALFGGAAPGDVARYAAEFQRAAAHEDWHRVLQLGRMLDGCEALSSEMRMSLAWGYFFLDARMLSSRWALAAEDVPADRAGARLYLSVISMPPPGSHAEILLRAKTGLAQIEAGLLPAVPDVHAALLKACADHAKEVEGGEAAFRYACAYAQEAATEFLRRTFYGVSLFQMNAVDVDPGDVYRRSLGYEEFFAHVRPYTHAKRSKKKKIRIGYISGDFRMHVMQYFIWPFFAGYDNESFEVYAYSLGKEDQYTAFFRTLVTQWRDLSTDKRAPEKIAARIYADEIDILFDLAGHTADTGLPALAWKPAPVQISGLGYMATTGLHAVDYFVTDRYCDPPGSGSEKYYVEKLLRLTSQFCYNGYTSLPVSTGTPARRKGYIQFASFNQYAKLRDDMLRAWREIMARVPDARLLLKNSAFGDHSGTAHAAYERMHRLGFDMSRVQFESVTKDYMQRYLDVDIALDTFPWPGGGTTCDALYMGVPVVSYYTKRHSTRFTYSLLANIGLADLASQRIEDYVETAVALAGNIDLLDALHRELRDRMKASPVMDQQRYIREMEECYRAIWTRWETQTEGI